MGIWREAQETGCVHVGGRENQIALGHGEASTGTYHPRLQSFGDEIC
jgi:hypothetical protein